VTICEKKGWEKVSKRRMGEERGKKDGRNNKRKERKCNKVLQ
jgi:hypothetical protein